MASNPRKDLIGAPTCGDCRHYTTDDKNGTRCWRYPPIVIKVAGDVFMMRPEVEDDELACGEFKGRH